MRIYGDEGMEHSLELEFKEADDEPGWQNQDRKSCLQHPCIVFSHDDIAFVRGSGRGASSADDECTSLFFDDLAAIGRCSAHNLSIKEGEEVWESMTSSLPIMAVQGAHPGWPSIVSRPL